MRTISWKHSVAALFAIAIFAACSDDTTTPATDGGPDGSTNLCGNKKVDTGEDCDGTVLGKSKTCSDATMGKMTSGTLGCTSKCKIDITKCTGGGGTGGGGGGGTSGTGGGGGTGGGPGGSGGVGKTDAGMDAGPMGKTDAGPGKTDAGPGKTDAGPTPVVDSGAKD
jgi:hypothetical protein